MDSKEANRHWGPRIVEALDLDNFAMDLINPDDVVDMLLARCKERLTFEVLLCCPHGMDEAERFNMIYMDGVPVAAEYYNMRWADSPVIRPSYYIGPKISDRKDKNQLCDMVFVEENLSDSVPETMAYVDGGGPWANSEGKVFFYLASMARHEGDPAWDRMINAARNTLIREVRTVYLKSLHEAPSRYTTDGMSNKVVQLTDDWIGEATAF